MNMLIIFKKYSDNNCPSAWPVDNYLYKYLTFYKKNDISNVI